MIQPNEVEASAIATRICYRDQIEYCLLRETCRTGVERACSRFGTSRDISRRCI